MGRKAIYTTPEAKKEYHRLWFYNKYHTDEEFRRKHIEKKCARVKRNNARQKAVNNNIEP